MNPSMDDRRVLAEMERRLAKDDPELVALMDALNHRFPDGDEHTDSRSDDGGRHDWRWKAIVAFALVLVVGLILTAVLSRSPSTGDNHGPPNSRAPAVSVHARGRGSRLGRAPRRRPATGLSADLPRGTGSRADLRHDQQGRRRLGGREAARRRRLPTGGQAVLATAAPDCTALEVADLMARPHSPLVAGVDRGAGGPDRLLGVVTAAHLMDQLLQA